MNLGLSPGDKAALRRGVDPWEVRGFYGLLKQFPDSPEWILALVAPVVADIRTPTTKRIGTLARGVLSEKRMRRLLNSTDREELIQQLRRVVAMCDREGNAQDIVDTVRYWGERARRQIAKDYFGGAEEE